MILVPIIVQSYITGHNNAPHLSCLLMLAAEERQRQLPRNVLATRRNLSSARLAAVLGSRGRSPSSNGSRGASPTAPPVQEKVLVFSQWTSMLDLLEHPLKQERCAKV